MAYPSISSESGGQLFVPGSELSVLHSTPWQSKDGIRDSSAVFPLRNALRRAASFTPFEGKRPKDDAIVRTRAAAGVKKKQMKSHLMKWTESSKRIRAAAVVKKKQMKSHLMKPKSRRRVQSDSDVQHSREVQSGSMYSAARATTNLLLILNRNLRIH
jgi:hypothetical protein